MSGHAGVVAELQSLLGIVLYIATPPLLGAMAVGLLVGILQAVTQVQDQSLPMTAKLVLVVVVLVLAGPLLATPLVRQAERLFDSFNALAQ